MTPQERWFRYERYLYLLARAVLVVGGVVAVGALLGLLRQTVTLLLVAFFLAYLLDPLLKKLQRRGLGRTAAVCALLGGAAVVALLVMLVLIPLVVADLGEMARRLPPRIDAAVAALPAWMDATFGVQMSPDIGAWLAQFADEAKAALPTLARSASGLFAGFARHTASLFGVLANLVLIPLFAFYLMRDFAPITRSLVDELVPPRLRPGMGERLERVDRVLGGFVRGQLTVCAVLAVVYTTGLLVAGVPLAFVIGPVAGLANVIPFVGGLLGVGMAAIVAALEGSGWTPFVGIAITFGLGQALEGLVLTPRLVGERVGLSPFAVILAVAAFGEAFGFVGILIAVPVAAVLKTLAPDLRRLWRESRFFAEHERN